MITTLTKTPVYCADCKEKGTWIRQPARDLKFESGKVFEEAYRCRACGAKTIVPVKENI